MKSKTPKEKKKEKKKEKPAPVASTVAPASAERLAAHFLEFRGYAHVAP